MGGVVRSASHSPCSCRALPCQIPAPTAVRIRYPRPPARPHRCSGVASGGGPKRPPSRWCHRSVRLTRAGTRCRNRLVTWGKVWGGEQVRKPR